MKIDRTVIRRSNAHSRQIIFFLFATSGILICLSHTDVNAQKFSFGVRGGAGIGWAGFGDKFQKDTFSTKPILNYHVGAQVGFPLKHEFQLIIEAGYSREGRRLMFNDGSWENRTVYNFAESQMLLRRGFKFYLDKNIPSEWFFSVGPDVNYLIKGKGRIIANRNKPGYAYDIIYNETPTSDYHHMYIDDPNRWLFGLVIGVGFKAPLRGNQRVSSELRFVSGHTYLGPGKGNIEILGFEDTQLTNQKSINLIISYTWERDVQQSRMGKSTIKKKLKRGN